MKIDTLTEATVAMQWYDVLHTIQHPNPEKLKDQSKAVTCIASRVWAENTAYALLTARQRIDARFGDWTILRASCAISK